MASVHRDAATEPIGTLSPSYLQSKVVKDTRELIVDLCRKFYSLGWVSGTGGSITIKVYDDSIPRANQLIVMSPSGVQKEQMEPEDMYVLDSNGTVISSPCAKPYPHKRPKCSDCAHVFLKAYDLCNAGAVIHSHGMECCLITMINSFSSEFRITQMEMIKGIQGLNYQDELVVPIIENTTHENELTDAFAEAVEAYPHTTAVLVRNHGIYIWGDSWISAKTQAECYHYLFDAVVKLRQLGLNGFRPNLNENQRMKGNISSDSNAWKKGWMHGNDSDLEIPLPQCILLDIEGTTTPISFVSDVLFPYSWNNIEKFLYMTYESSETKNDIKLLRSQVEVDLIHGVDGALLIPMDDAGKEKVIAALVTNVQAMITCDRKVTALKQLQGHIWRTGFQNHELEGIVFDDVPKVLEKWHAIGIKMYIYSSGSRLSQRLLFGNTNHGDLRKYLSGFFDTQVGSKNDPCSYAEISESLGVDNPCEILYLTDVFLEATAARAAGMQVIIINRPGNDSLPEENTFRTICSFLEIGSL